MNGQALNWRMLTVLAATFIGTPLASFAQAPTDFYRDKTITLVVGSPPGGGYDAYAQILSRYFGRFLGGNTAINVQYMPGAGSLRAANYLFNQAPSDGTVIGTVEPLLVLNQAFKYPGVDFDLPKFDWIGRLATTVEMTVAWNPSPVTTIDEAWRRELVIGAASAGGSSAGLPRVMNAVVGTKFKIIPGYGGMNGIALAMERGEVQGGHATVSELLTEKRDWVTKKKVSILVQYSLDRHPQFPDVPTMIEFGRTSEEKQVLSIFGSMADIGRTLLAPPGTPADRVETLRKAFTATVTDATVRIDVDKLNLEFEPLSGDALQRRIQATFGISPSVAKIAAKAWTWSDGH
jgi:tripartite-type tricarboxylate transporter receptor subunit TctC